MNKNLHPTGELTGINSVNISAFWSRQFLGVLGFGKFFRIINEPGSPPWYSTTSLSFSRAVPSSKCLRTVCLADSVEPATPASRTISIPSFITKSCKSSFPFALEQFNGFLQFERWSDTGTEWLVVVGNQSNTTSFECPSDTGKGAG